MKKQSLFLLVPLAIFGCQPQTAVRPTAVPAPGTTTSTTEPAPQKISIPDEVRTEGFSYYGIDRKEPLKVELVAADSPAKKGAIEFTLLEAKDGRLVFEQSYTGDISSSLGGTSKLFADKTGIYGTAMLGATFDEPQLEMPAKVAAGTTWKMAKPVKADSFTINGMTNRIIGFESVTVPLGTFEALKMESAASLVQGTVKSTAVLTAWLVKDVGMVKLVIKSTGADGKSQQQTIQAIK